MKLFVYSDLDMNIFNAGTLGLQFFARRTARVKFRGKHLTSTVLPPSGESTVTDGVEIIITQLSDVQIVT